MGENTKIPWARHTFNPVIGCTPVGPGCDNCYAERMAKRMHVKFGEREPRKLLSEAYWKKPIRWDIAAWRKGVHRRVFCGSMCDVFDKHIPVAVRDRLWDLIEDTQNLDWLLLTKRAPNIVKYLDTQSPNIWLGVTVEDRTHGLKRMSILQDTSAVMRFLSIEPLLEDLGQIDLWGIDWVIVGGESGPHSRSMHRRWAESIRFQCIDQGVPFFMKQMSEHDHGKTFRDISTFPSVLQVRQFPGDL